MPLTPFHWGPGSFIGLIFFKFFDFPTLLIASVIVDIEPFSVLMFNLNYPLHGFFHSILGGSILAILTALVLYFLRNKIRKIMAILRLAQDSSFKKNLLTSFFGVYFHLLLDAFIHKAMKPFYPFEINPFLGLFTFEQLHIFSAISFLIGILIYLIKFHPRDKFCA